MQKKHSVFLLIFILVVVITLNISHSAFAVQVTLTGFTGFGYNVIPTPDGNPDVIGCGPTSGTMVLNWYTNTIPAPGLIVNPLADARSMTTYMSTDAEGYGTPRNFQYGLEAFAKDRGYLVDAYLHVEPTTYNPSGWPGYDTSPGNHDIETDATFWNTTTWDINDNDFLNFLKTQIDNGDPVVLTVDSDGLGVVSNNGFFAGDDHWMAAVGYDLAAQQWAGFNTWDTTLHWYNVTSAFHTGETQTGGFWEDVNQNGILGDDNDRYWKQAGNIMGISYARTFDFEGPTTQPVPEPSTFLLVGAGIVGLGLLRKRFNK